MRVTMITPYPPAHGAVRSGVEGYSRRLAAVLAGTGADMTVVAQRLDGEPDTSADGDVAVLRRFDRGAGALPAAAAAALETGAEVVHVQHEVFLYGGPGSVPGLPLALRRLRRAGAGPVVTLHQVVQPGTVDADFTRIHRVRVPPVVARVGLAAVQRTVRRQAAATIVHAPSFADILAGARVVAHGVDHSPVPPPAEAKAALGLPTGPLVVLCFGFLAPYKGLETVLSAAALAGPEVLLVVAGGAHPRLAGRDPYAETLESRFGDVARFTGFVPETDVASWFGAADVVLVPHPRPFSSSGPLAQAIGYGRPVLMSEAMASCVGADNLLAFAPRPAALAARLVDLARTPAALSHLEDASRELARGRSWDEVAAAHHDIYREVSRAPRPSGDVLAPV